jgi:hypothetical protein
MRQSRKGAPGTHSAGNSGRRRFDRQEQNCMSEFEPIESIADDAMYWTAWRQRAG